MNTSRLGNYSYGEVFVVFLISIIILLLAFASEAFRIAVHESFLSSIMGAMVGGSIAIFGQLLTIREARSQRLAQQLADDGARATALLFKLTKMHNNIAGMHAILKKNLVDRPHQRHLEGDPWQFFAPIVHFPQAFTFRPDELAVLLPIVGATLFQDCMALDDRHNEGFAIVRKASELRTMFVTSLEPNEVLGDMVAGNIDFTQRQLAEIAALNDLITGALRRFAIDEEKSRHVLTQVGDLLRNKLGISISIIV